MADKELMRRLKAILFAAVWLGCISGFIVSTHSTLHFLDLANKAPGVVVALNAGGSHPQIEFINSNGRRVSYPQEGLISGYKIGDKVTVLYLADSPNPQATIDKPGAIWELPFYFAFMAIPIPSIELTSRRIKKLDERGKSEQWKITE
ncbi:DUF3592 domain-containing protein [Paraburkholderia dipogonis]|uniref:DUF3592 domain-containing protein n=1 Tax=Paraburkholderia dipogonis TaxID=1211383 RepID=A0A4Y8N4R7_9BURK|nr:DUF3592 domain-containing protein [Paraburkholderia dipogonis]TFE44631.1 DUF3592 domain-containing protein [Paraburkholderia dipogonis]